jgi:ABC-type multidrug transport system ATPase subunit
MKQRILLAGAILNDPTFLILDEPTAGLDPRERIRIRNLISSIAANKIVLIATHVVQDIECISNQVILMDRGNVVRKDTIAHLTGEVKPFVYEICVPQESIPDIEYRYKVSSILSDGNMAQIRLISKHDPTELSSQRVLPSLEDVYLYHFGEMENEGESL